MVKSILGEKQVYPKSNIVKKEGYTLKVNYFGVNRDHADYPVGSIKLEGPDLKISLGNRLSSVSLTGLPLLVASEKTVTTSTLIREIVHKYNIRPDEGFLRELLREGLRPYMKVQSPESFC